MNYIEITAIILVGSVFLLGKSVFFVDQIPNFFAGLNRFFRWLNHPTVWSSWQNHRSIPDESPHFLDVNFTVSSVRNFQKKWQKSVKFPKIG